MNRRSDADDERNFTRDLLIGLGESSVRKSYYPELQQRMLELERFRLLLDQAGDAIFLVHENTKKIVDCNQMARSCSTAISDELIGSKVSDYLGINLLPETGDMQECFLKYKNGQFHPVEVSTRRVTIQSDNFLVIVARDITERKQAEQDLLQVHEELHANFEELEQTQLSLLASENRYRRVVEISSDAIWDWDMCHNIWSISHQWAMRLGLIPLNVDDENPQIIVDNFQDIWNSQIHHEDLALRQKVFAEHLSGKSDIYEVEYRFLIPPERWIWLSDKGKIMFDSYGKPIRMIGSYSDITTRKYHEGRIHHMAYHDALTDLPNRSNLYEKMLDILAVEENNEFHGVLFLINIDNFKFINDSWGYSCGDSLLVAIAERLNEKLSDQGLIARIGGNEFAILLSYFDPHQLEPWAQRILNLFAKPFFPCGNKIFLTSSMGVVIFTNQTAADTILGNANTALHCAKMAGKKTWKLFRDEMQQAVVLRIQMESELQQALALQQFLVYYQPQIDIISGQIIALEALVRWEHPKKGIVPPLSFIPLAEETGMIIPLGDWVMRSACRFGNSFRKLHKKNMRIAVNVSAQQLMQEDFLQRVRRILREENYPPELLELEITETILMESLEANVIKLKELRDFGIRISLDDFGTGYSSFTYLSRLPIDVLKIDKSFLREIGTNANGTAIISTIIQLAHQMNIAVVAEGVETEEQLQLMKIFDCDYIQGFLFSRPLPAHKIVEVYDLNNGVLSQIGS